MDRRGVARVRKIVPVGVVASLLFCAPLQLAAQERESAAARIPAIAWLTSLWSDLTVGFAGEPVSAQPEPELPAANKENGCAVDPNGGCGG